MSPNGAEWRRTDQYSLNSVIFDWEQQKLREEVRSMPNKDGKGPRGGGPRDGHGGGVGKGQGQGPGQGKGKEKGTTNPAGAKAGAKKGGC